MININFCGYPVPNDFVTLHFLLVGMTGSGKTNILRILMRSALLNVMSEPNYRALVYDQKGDMVSFIKAQGITDNELRILNPYDKRCHEWDIARDVTGQDTAFQIASIFIPEEDSQNRYFTDAARSILAGVMNVFIEKGIERQAKTKLKPDWRLADVVYAMQNKKRIRHILEQTTGGQELIELHLENEKTTASILSTLDTRLRPLIVPAALWRKAGDNDKKISLEEFLGGRYVLVLGNNQKARLPLQSLNRILFQRLTELVLDSPNVSDEELHPRRVWFFLDETRKIGKLDGLDDLLSNVRSKGGAVVLAFQDIDGMRLVYRKEAAQEITSQCGHYCFLKMSGTETPLWASQTMGEYEETATLPTTGETSGGGERRFTDGTSTQFHKTSIVMPSMLTSLEYPSRKQGQGIRLFARIPCIDKNVLDCTDKQRLQPHKVEEWQGPKSPDLADDNHPWPEINDYYFKQLPEWRTEMGDYERLGIPAIPPITGNSRQEQNETPEIPPSEKQEQVPQSGKKRIYRGSA